MAPKVQPPISSPPACATLLILEESFPFCEPTELDIADMRLRLGCELTGTLVLMSAWGDWPQHHAIKIALLVYDAFPALTPYL